MNKFVRFYNQNRALCITTIIGIVLIIMFIQIINSYMKESANDKNIIGGNSSTDKSTTISPSNVSSVTGETVKNNETDKTTIKTFVEYCNKKNYDAAYDMLTNDCKTSMFPEIEQFQKNYVDRIFYINRMYTLENWYSEGRTTTYYIKYIEDILATGETKSEDNISDYITVIKNDDRNYININNFVNAENINKSKTLNGVTITVDKLYIYMDYVIASLKIKNNTGNIVCLDTRKDIQKTYLYDTNDVKYTALLNENSEEELKVRAKTSKTLNIKFNKMYNTESREIIRTCI